MELHTNVYQNWILPFTISFNILSLYLSTPTDNDHDHDDNDSDNDYNYQHYPNHIDTQRIEEIPAKEPKPNAVPLKSALKKKPGHNVNSSSSPATPVQDHTNANGTLPQGAGNSSGGGSGGGGVNSSNNSGMGNNSSHTSTSHQRPLVVRQDATNSYNLKWVACFFRSFFPFFVELHLTFS